MSSFRQLLLVSQISQPYVFSHTTEVAMDFGNIFHKNSELKEYLWQHPEVTEYVMCPPPVQMCFANLWGQIMQWSVVKKVGKNKYSTNFILYHTSIYRYINDSAMCHFA